MYMKLQNIMVAALLLTAAIPSIYARQTDDGRHRYAIVNLSVNFLREGPDYTAELGTQALSSELLEKMDTGGRSSRKSLILPGARTWDLSSWMHRSWKNTGLPPNIYAQPGKAPYIPPRQPDR